MPLPSLPPVSEILSGRSGEEMALNDRFLNPQMGRILRTLGFDKVWTGGEGAHLIDSDGERYLDLFGGYGVFAIEAMALGKPVVCYLHEEALRRTEEALGGTFGPRRRKLLNVYSEIIQFPLS